MSSGSSDEIIRMATPWATSSRMSVVDRAPGADVDAAGRLVEHDHLRLGDQPLGQHDLLLVAAGEEPHLLAARRAATSSSDDRIPGMPARRPGPTRRDRTASSTSRALAVTDWLSTRPSALRSSVTSASPAAHGLPRRAQRHRRPSSRTVPRVNGSTPNSAVRDLGAAAALQPGQRRRSRRRAPRRSMPSSCSLPPPASSSRTSPASVPAPLVREERSRSAGRPSCGPARPT